MISFPNLDLGAESVWIYKVQSTWIESINKNSCGDNAIRIFTALRWPFSSFVEDACYLT